MDEADGEEEGDEDEGGGTNELRVASSNRALQ